MEIHQLICGETSKKSWGLLQTTIDDLELANSIAFISNLHDESGSVDWKPVIRIFFFNDKLLIIKTFPDTSIEVRNGRAFSHVLIIDQEEGSKVKELGSVLQLLPENIDKVGPFNVLTAVNEKSLSLIETTNFSRRFKKVIHGYVHEANYLSTIIWVGQGDFELAVANFWKILSIKDRLKISVGICFNTIAVPVDSLNLITVPDSIENKFLNKGYCVVRKNDDHISNSLSELILSDEPAAIKRIQTFKDKLEINHLSFEQIAIIERVMPTFENLNKSNDLKKFNSLSSVVAAYSPDAEKGKEFKDLLVQKIATVLQGSDLDGVNLLRSFNTDSFKNSKAKLSTAIDEWLRDNLFSKSKSAKNNFSTLFSLVYSDNLQNWWAKLIREEIAKFLENLNQSTVVIFLNWIRMDFKYFDVVSDKIDSSSIMEQYFLKGTDKIIAKKYQDLLIRIAQSKSWMSYHAHIMKQTRSIEIAISDQIVFDKDPLSIAGIRLLCSDVDNKKVISIAVSSGDSRLIDTAIARCEKDSNCLNDINFKDINWLKIWSGALQKNGDPGKGFKQPLKKIHHFLDLNVSEEINYPEIVELISSSHYANLLDYPQRNALWPKITVSAKDRFLKATSSSLLESVSKFPTTTIPEDQHIKDYIRDYGLSEFLYYNRNSLKITIPVFNAITDLQDHILRDYLRNYSGSVSAIEAVQLGAIIQKRQYRNSAYEIYHRAKSNNNWKHALTECHRLLDFGTKAVLAISGTISNVNIPTNDWWEGAIDIISDLYPTLEKIVTLWKHAGGKESDIVSSASGSSIWFDLIWKLQRSQFRKVSMESLLDEINKKYRANSQFELVYKLRKNYI